MSTWGLVLLAAISVVGFMVVLARMDQFGAVQDWIASNMEHIMAQIDDIDNLLDTITTEVDALLEHTGTIEQELKDAQAQIANNQAPDLSVTLQKVTALKERLEGVQSTVSNPSSPQGGVDGGVVTGGTGDQGAGTPASGTADQGSTSQGADQGATDQGDALGGAQTTTTDTSGGGTPGDTAGAASGSADQETDPNQG